MPIPKRIIQCWFGERPEDIRQMMLTVSQHHPDWEILVFHEDNIKDLGLNFADLMDKCQNFASVSNVVRLHAVHVFGGYWIDSDVKCLKPLDPLLGYKATACFQDAEERLCNAVFSAEPGHPWIKWQLERKELLLDADAAKSVYLMTEAPRDGLIILPQEFYYPFGFENPPKDRTPPDESYTDHFWKGSWSVQKI